MHAQHTAHVNKNNEHHTLVSLCIYILKWDIAFTNGDFVDKCVKVMKTKTTNLLMKMDLNI